MIKLVSGLFIVVSIKAIQSAVRTDSEWAPRLSLTVAQLTEQLIKLGPLGHHQSDVHHALILTSKLVLISDLFTSQIRTEAVFLRKVLLGYIRNTNIVAI